MVYTDRELLNVFENDGDSISMNQLKCILQIKKTNIIYFEKNGRLMGLVSSGDIQRACTNHLDFVRLNRVFVHVNSVTGFIEAKKLFSKKANILNIPVLEAMDYEVMFGAIITKVSNL